MLTRSKTKISKSSSRVFSIIFFFLLRKYCYYNAWLSWFFFRLSGILWICFGVWCHGMGGGLVNSILFVYFLISVGTLNKKSFSALWKFVMKNDYIESLWKIWHVECDMDLYYWKWKKKIVGDWLFCLLIFFFFFEWVAWSLL